VAVAGGVPPLPPGRADAACAYGGHAPAGRWAVQQRPSSALPQLSTATSYPADSPPRQLQEEAQRRPAAAAAVFSSSQQQQQQLGDTPSSQQRQQQASLSGQHHSRRAGNDATSAPPSACSATGPIPHSGRRAVAATGKLGRSSNGSRGGSLQWASPEPARPASRPPPPAQQQPGPAPGEPQQPGPAATAAAASPLAHPAPAQQRGSAALSSAASSASHQASNSSRAGNAFDVPCSHQMVMPVVVSGAAGGGWAGSLARPRALG
jgi:hypothetical protein